MLFLLQAGVLPAQEFKIRLEPLMWHHSRRTPGPASIRASEWLIMVCFGYWKGAYFPWALCLWIIKQCIHGFWVLGLYHLRVLFSQTLDEFILEKGCPSTEGSGGVLPPPDCCGERMAEAQSS